MCTEPEIVGLHRSDGSVATALDLWNIVHAGKPKGPALPPGGRIAGFAAAGAPLLTPAQVPAPLLAAPQPHRGQPQWL